MRCWLVRICVLLVLGAIVNVAVAWGCAMWARTYAGLTSGPGFASMAFPDYRGEVILDGAWDTGLWNYGAGHSEWERLSIEPLVYQRTVSAGWPVLSLTGALFNNKQSDGVLLAPESMASQIVANGRRRLIPFRPIWPGFAINTVFYAVMLWLLFAAPLALRRRRRIKRGLCPKCAYDLRGSTAAICPECGATK